MEAGDELIESTFVEISFDGFHVTPKGLYEHIETVAHFNEENGLEQSQAKVLQKGERNLEQKLPNLFKKPKHLKIKSKFSRH